MKKLVLLVAFVMTAWASPALAFGGLLSESNRPSEKSGGTFAQGEALRNGTFFEGEVLFSRAVAIEGKSGESTGQLAGAALGGILGSKAGKGNGKYAGIIVGALLGGGVGGSVGRSIGEDKATEIFVRLEDGRKVSIVQIMDREVRSGDRVFVTQSNGGNFRVVSLASMN